MLDKLTAQGNLVNEQWQGECFELGKQEGFGKLSQENEWGESSQGGGWDQGSFDPPWEGEYCDTQDGISQDREWGAPSQGEGWDQSTQVICDPPWDGDCQPGDELYQEQGSVEPSQQELDRLSQVESFEPSKNLEPGEAKFGPDETSEWSDGWTMP